MKIFFKSYELIKYLEEVIVPYFKRQRSIEVLDESQKALVIMDVLTGQMSPEILGSYKAYSICVIHVPGNLNKHYQALDLTVNHESNIFLQRKFVDWYSYLVSNQLSEDKPLESVEVLLKLSII